MPVDEAHTTEPDLAYDEVLEEFSEDFRDNYRENAGPTGAGIESEIPLVGRDSGVMPPSSFYQEILGEGLWESIESELEENVEGYGDEFRFELKDVKEKGHFEEMPAEMVFEVTGEPDEMVGSPAIDWEIGPQLEIDPGAFQIDGSGNFGTLLDVLTGIKEGTRKYIEENFPELRFGDQGLTRQFRRPGDIPDDPSDLEMIEGEAGNKVVRRGIGEEYGSEEALEFAEEFYDHFSSTEYCADYIATIFGPQIMENMFGGSTQLTSGLWQEEGEIDIDQRLSEEMAYRIVFEGAFDVLTSNVYSEENGEEERQVGVNQDYWKNSAYGQHFLNGSEVDEEALDRTGTPWPLIERMMEGEEEKGVFREVLDHYMTEHSMAWIAPPGEEYVDIEGEVPEEFEYDDLALLTVDPENPKTPREYIEDGEVGFTKVLKDGAGGLKRVSGTVDISEMDEREKKQYHKENFAEAHIGGMHHDIRPKFLTGGYEYRNARQNYEKEPSVALAKAAVLPHGDKIVDAMKSYGEGIDPSDPESVPDYDDEEAWREIFSEVYDEEVMSTAESMAPGYAGEFREYVDKRLSEPKEARSVAGERTF